METLKQKLIQDQTKKICRVYKISPEKASEKLLKEMDSNLDLIELVNSAKSLKHVYKTRLFKDFIKKVKKEIYYSLRTYQKPENNADNENALVDTHISTKERSPYIKHLFKQIDEYVKEAETVLDVGGGMFPALFPFEDYPNLKYYIWVDKDKTSYQKLKQQNYQKLTLYNHRIGEYDWSEYLPEGKDKFDFVFMLKVVPVIARQEKELLDELINIPFYKAVVTGSKEAMTKKINIERREDAIIREFLQKAGWGITKKVDIPTEFGYIVD